MTLRTRIVVMLALAAACAPPPEPRPAEEPLQLPEPDRADVEDARRAFPATRDAFLAWYYDAYPVRATRLGIHDHDGELQAMDRASMQRRIDDLLDWLGQLDGIPAMYLEQQDRFDYQILEFAIRAELLELEESREWANDPRLYIGEVAAGLSSVAARDYAPVQERVADLTSRMAAAPAVLQSARDNLTSPPRIWTELAIVETQGLRDYVETGLVADLEAQSGGPVTDPGLVAARGELLDALDRHMRWLRTELLPRSTGNFRLGQYLFQRKVLYEEHVNLTLDELDRLNEQAIMEYRERLDRVAAEIDPGRTTAAIVDSITRLHPAQNDLVPAARELMEEARRWTAASDVVTIPAGEPPIVREAPSYARPGLAFLDAPGPFDEPGLATYFNITSVDSTWTEAQRREHLTYFNYPGLLGVTLHETYPGNYVQVLHARRSGSAVRKTFMPASLVEGWAHYSEEMALDEGLRGLDPVVRAGQLRRALQRHARWYAGLHLHAFGRPVEEVVRRYMEIALVPELPARREVTRATYDPTYLYYALGRMQILELRKDYREHLDGIEGQEFSLREFHDTILGLTLPLTLARDALIPQSTRQTRPARRR